MVSLDKLPYEMLLMIFSYLSIYDLSLSIRNVCIRWRKVSENSKIWGKLAYFPQANTPKSDYFYIAEYAGTEKIAILWNSQCHRTTL
jgi:hypothetical protein